MSIYTPPPGLIDFWRMKRMKHGELCEVMPFHEEIADRLTKLVLGTLSKPNLMILMPPRCAKTDLGVKAFIPWAHGWFPDAESIITSYGQPLATESCVDCRDTMATEWYKELSGSDWGATVKLVGDKASGRMDHFRTAEGGSVKGVGRGGGVTGFGAGKLRETFGGLIVIDDLLKAQEATSPKKRKEAWDYIQGTLNSRRNRQESPATPRLLIMQRLHPEDPAGMLLREEPNLWDVLQIPAHEGEKVIWPGRLDYEEMIKMADTDPDTYFAQYLQSPQQDETRKILKQAWWAYWRNRLELERKTTLKIITGDTAFQDHKKSDWSVLQCWGFNGISGMHLVDQVRGQWQFPDLLRESKAFVDKHTKQAQANRFTPATEFWIENKASGISLVQTLRREGIAARPWEPKDATPKDKVGRAKHAAVPLSAGRVALPDPTLPENAWVKQLLLPEMGAFTNDDSHLNDDQVDTFTMAVSIWIERGGGVGPLPNYGE